MNKTAYMHESNIKRGPFPMGKTAMLRIYATIVCALLSLTETRNCGNVIEPFYQDPDSYYVWFREFSSRETY